MTERQEPYITATQSLSYPVDAQWIALTERERKLITQWRKQPDGQAVIVAPDMARFMAKVIEHRNHARQKAIGPIAVVNLLSLAVGTVNEL